MSQSSLRRLGILFSAGLIIAISAATMIFALSAQAFIGLTGAPGEDTCFSCHTSMPLNGGPGRTVLTASQSSYAPGDTIHLRINVIEPGKKLWAFQTTVLDRNANKIGALRKTDTTTVGVAIDPQSGRNYIDTDRNFRYPGMLDSAPGWQFDWIAPDSFQGPAIFYAVGYAGNLDTTEVGDNIYTIAIPIPMGSYCCTPNRDYIDCTVGLDLLDLTVLVDHLFITFSPLCCELAADLDNSSSVDLIDLTSLVDHLVSSPI